MLEEKETVFNSINIDNISSISQRQSELQEMRVIELHELADLFFAPISELINDGMSISEIFTYIAEYLVLPLDQVHSSALEFNLHRLTHYASLLSSMDKSVFSDFLTERIKRAGISVTEKDFLSVNDSPQTFVYLKNPLSDEAYDVFSENFSDPRVRYAASLKDVAKAVFDGDVTYGLLPLEEGGGERLHSASELIFRYDLKINLVTPVFGLDGSSDMKYALVSRKYYVPSMEPGDDAYLEVRVDSNTSLSELLCASDYFGATVYRIKSESFEFDADKENCYSLVLKKDGGDFGKLLAYLTMFIKTCVFVGIYKNLE